MSTSPLPRPLRVVVVTSGSPLLLPIVRRLAGDPAVQLAGIVFDTEHEQQRRPLRRTVRRIFRYYGFRGGIVYLGMRLLARAGLRPSRQRPESLPSSLDAFCRSNAISLARVGNINAEPGLRAIRRLDAHLGVVVGTRILKPEVFSLPPRGMINVHQGLIPEYRGGAPVFWSLYNGEREVGVSIHEVVEAVDAGAVILKQAVALDYDYARYGSDYEQWMEEVYRRLDALGVELMAQAVHLIAAGKAQKLPVDPGRGRRYRKPTFRQKQELRRMIKKRYAA